MTDPTWETAPGGGVLFVRSVRDLQGPTVEVNEWLAWRGGVGLPTDEVLAIVVGEGAHESGVAAHPGWGGSPSVRLRESVAISCRWELAFYEISGALARPRAEERRRLILDHLLPSTDDAERPWRPARALLVVFTGSEARVDLRDALEPLRARYGSTPIGRDAFLHTPSRGLVRLPTRGPARALDAHLPS